MSHPNSSIFFKISSTFISFLERLVPHIKNEALTLYFSNVSNNSRVLSPGPSSKVKAIIGLLGSITLLLSFVVFSSVLLVSSFVSVEVFSLLSATFFVFSTTPPLTLTTFLLSLFFSIKAQPPATITKHNINNVDITRILSCLILLCFFSFLVILFISIIYIYVS